MARGIFAVVMVFLTATASAAPPTIVDYGRRCYEAMGVELPAINCLSPESTVLAVAQNGREVGSIVDSCDKPALLHPDKACVPGARLLKFTQTNPKGETVTTMVLCRRKRVPSWHLSPRQLWTEPKLNDIGVIQFNEDTHQACWYFKERDDGLDVSKVPPPFSPDWADKPGSRQYRAAVAYWETPQVTASGRCTKCHDSGPWIRTPYVAQANGTPNAVPKNPAAETHHVEMGNLFKDWNGSQGPFRIRVRKEAWLSSWPASKRAHYQRLLENGQVAPLDTCTSCHGLGKSRQPQHRNSGTCGYLFEGAVSGNISRGLHPGGWLTPWMPPANALTQSRWNGFYYYALEAARGCCANPAKTDPAGNPACL